MDWTYHDEEHLDLIPHLPLKLQRALFLSEQDGSKLKRFRLSHTLVDLSLRSVRLALRQAYETSVWPAVDALCVPHHLKPHLKLMHL